MCPARRLGESGLAYPARTGDPQRSFTTIRGAKAAHREMLCVAFYNRNRMHSSLDYHSPEEYETLHNAA